MVDVSAKPVMLREAVASGEVRLQKATLMLIESQTIAKGNVLHTVILAIIFETILLLLASTPLITSATTATADKLGLLSGLVSGGTSQISAIDPGGDFLTVIFTALAHLFGG